MEDFHINAFNDSLGLSRINMTFTSRFDINNARISLTFLGKTRETIKEFDKEHMRVNIEYCNLAKGMLGFFVGTVIRNLLAQHSNLEFVCPIKKMTYQLINAPTVDDGLLPTYLFGFRGPFEMSLVVIGQFNKAKGLRHIITVKMVGNIIP